MSKLKNILLYFLSLVLVAGLAVSGTVAYLKDDDSAVNVMTLGNVYIQQIEQERDANGNLVPFTQGKPALPAVYEGESIPWADASEWVVANDPAWKVVEDNVNVVDKFVSVKNTGISDAYVRTIIAFELGKDKIGDPYMHLVHNTTDNGTPWSFEWAKDENDEAITIEIDGSVYAIGVYTYTKVLKPGVTTVPNVKQIYLGKDATNEVCAAYGETFEIIALSQAVQVAGFDAPATALNAGFGEVNDENVEKWFGGMVKSSTVSSDEALKEALTSDENTIVVSLDGDVTYDVAAWAANGMGGKNTETIIINGNGHTITFNNTDSDWNNVVTNGAKLIINNATITNSGHDATSGTWNGHDIVFNCEVEFNDVTFLNAVAVEENAVFNNCKITDDSTGDSYLLWICANGQNVVLNGCEIDATGTDGDDRGIKIDNEYNDDADGPVSKLVTLTVKNTTFKTEKKAAILVKTPAGAVINLENVDIAGVKADPMHEVWVDSAAAEYADLVTVNGGNKIVEGTVKVTTVTSAAELSAAINDAETDAIYVDNANLTLGTFSANGKDITFNGGSVDFGTTDGFTKGIQHSGTVTYNNVTITGSVSLYGTKEVFNKCTFDLTGIADYLWTYGAKEVEFNNCTFDTKGKAILVYNEGTVGSSVVTVNGCTFKASESAFAGASAVQPCAAVEVDSSLIPGTYTINFVGKNVIDSDFCGYVRVKTDGGKGNVVINGVEPTALVK